MKTSKSMKKIWKLFFPFDFSYMNRPMLAKILWLSYMNPAILAKIQSCKRYIQVMQTLEGMISPPRTHLSQYILVKVPYEYNFLVCALILWAIYYL